MHSNKLHLTGFHCTKVHSRLIWLHASPTTKLCLLRFMLQFPTCFRLFFEQVKMSTTVRTKLVLSIKYLFITFTVFSSFCTSWIGPKVWSNSLYIIEKCTKKCSSSFNSIKIFFKVMKLTMVIVYVIITLFTTICKLYGIYVC